MDNRFPEASLASRITATPEGMKVWQRERVMVEITERICDLMDANGVSRADLAKSLGKTRGYVTHILKGNANLTIATISDVYLALSRQFHPDDGPIDIGCVDAPKIITFYNPDQEDDASFEDEGELQLTVKVN